MPAKLNLIEILKIFNLTSFAGTNILIDYWQILIKTNVIFLKYSKFFYFKFFKL